MKTLGRTGIEITEIGFGAWAIGGRGYGDVAETDAISAIETYLELGGNFIDTARRYGESERILGEYLTRTGQDVVIASKSGVTDPDELRAELEESLRLLQRDTIDLYYLHAPPDDPDEINRVLDLYQTFKQEGKIRAIGASIKGPNVTQKTVDLCRQYIQTGKVDALQVIYSIFRQKNAEMMQEAEENGVAIIGRTVLESGFLTGKYKPGHVFGENDHRRRWSGERLKRILEHTQNVEQIARDNGFESVIQMAIRFALDVPGMTSIIPSGKTSAQVRGNMENIPSMSDDLRAQLVDMFGDEGLLFNTGSEV